MIRAAVFVTAGTLSSSLPGGSTSADDVTDFAFGPPEVIPLVEGLAPTCISINDRNGDGYPDAIVTGRSPDHIVLLLEGGPGGVLSVSGQLDSGGQSDWITEGDIDGDGDRDLLVAMRTISGRIAIYESDGQGGYDEEPRFLLAGREIRCIELADLDEDGALDLVATGHRSEDVVVFAGDGDGGFEPVSRRRLAPWKNGYVYPQSLVVTDLDLDGRSDIVSTSIGARSIHVSLGEDPSKGGDSFSPIRSWVAPEVDGQVGGCAYLSVADYDSDGRVEFVSPQTTWGQQWFVVFQVDENGDISSTEAMRGSPFGISWFAEAGDFDGDGDDDLCISHALPGVVIFMENVTEQPGSVSFRDPQWFFSGEFIRHSAACDIDLDGDLDLVALDYTGDQMLLFRNGAQGGLAAGVDDGAGPTPAPAVVPPHLDGLTGPDLLLALSRMSPDEVLELASWLRGDEERGGDG